MKKTIKAVIILVLLLPFYVIPSQQSIKKNIQKVGVGQEFAQKFPKLCFTLASSDMQVEPIFMSIGPEQRCAMQLKNCLSI